MNYDVKPEDRETVERYITSLKLSEPISPEELQETARVLIGDRGLLVYIIWKTLEQLHPEINAVKVLSEACRRFGEVIAKRMGPASTAAEFMIRLTSRTGMLAFDQQVIELDDDKAVKMIAYCPHMEAVRAEGVPKEEVAKLCRDIMMARDFGIIKHYPQLSLTFPGKTCGEGGCCALTVVRKPQ